MARHPRVQGFENDWTVYLFNLTGSQRQDQRTGGFQDSRLPHVGKVARTT